MLNLEIVVKKLSVDESIAEAVINKLGIEGRTTRWEVSGGS